MLKRLAGSSPVLGILFRSVFTADHSVWAVGSVVEHLVHTEGVTGSNPVLPMHRYSFDLNLTSSFGVSLSFSPQKRTKVSKPAPRLQISPLLRTYDGPRARAESAGGRAQSAGSPLPAGAR